MLYVILKVIKDVAGELLEPILMMSFMQIIITQDSRTILGSYKIREDLVTFIFCTGQNWTDRQLVCPVQNIDRLLGIQKMYFSFIRNGKSEKSLRVTVICR